MLELSLNKRVSLFVMYISTIIFVGVLVSGMVEKSSDLKTLLIGYFLDLLLTILLDVCQIFPNFTFSLSVCLFQVPTLVYAKYTEPRRTTYSVRSRVEQNFAQNEQSRTSN